MIISFSDRVEGPKHALVRLVEKESVFLNLETENYCGLDETGTRMCQVTTAAISQDQNITRTLPFRYIRIAGS